MARLKIYFRGSTLVETLVSMTLIVIILGASFTALTGVAHSTMTQVRFKARFVVKNLLADDHPVIKADTVNIDFGGFFIEEESLSFDDTTNLRILVVRAIAPDGKIIFSGRRIIIGDDD